MKDLIREDISKNTVADPTNRSIVHNEISPINSVTIRNGSHVEETNKSWHSMSSHLQQHNFLATSPTV